MPGHSHDSTAGTQNQGNSLGDRSSVRQSRLYRVHESGNDVKAILGSSNLCWNPDIKEGAYYGQKVYNHMTADHASTVAPNQLRHENYRDYDSGGSGYVPSNYKVPQYRNEDEQEGRYGGGYERTDDYGTNDGGRRASFDKYANERDEESRYAIKNFTRSNVEEKATYRRNNIFPDASESYEEVVRGKKTYASKYDHNPPAAVTRPMNNYNSGNEMSNYRNNQRFNDYNHNNDALNERNAQQQQNYQSRIGEQRVMNRNTEVRSTRPW